MGIDPGQQPVGAGGRWLTVVLEESMILRLRRGWAGSAAVGSWERLPGHLPVLD